MAGADLREARLDRDATTQLLGACIDWGPGKLPHIDWTVLPLATLKWGEMFHLAECAIADLQVMQREGALVVLPEDENGVPVLGDPEQELVKKYRALMRSYQHLAVLWQAQELDAYAKRLRRRADVMRNNVVRRHADPDGAGPSQDEPNEDAPL